MFSVQSCGSHSVDLSHSPGNLTPPASITDNSKEMVEVESVSIQWRGAAAKKVEVAGQFSNWQPLSLSRQEEGDSWGIRYRQRRQLKQRMELINY